MDEAGGGLGAGLDEERGGDGDAGNGGLEAEVADEGGGVGGGEVVVGLQIQFGGV